jgi:hypothetical protein
MTLQDYKDKMGNLKEEICNSMHKDGYDEFHWSKEQLDRFMDQAAVLSAEYAKSTCGCAKCLA